MKSGCKVFSYGLAGSNILLSDCIQACTTILSSKKLQVVGMIKVRVQMCEVRVQMCEVRVQMCEVRMQMCAVKVWYLA